MSTFTWFHAVAATLRFRAGALVQSYQEKQTIDSMACSETKSKASLRYPSVTAKVSVEVK
jgi:hypothetical protein